jgi:hypothetical protein
VKAAQLQRRRPLRNKMKVIKLAIKHVGLSLNCYVSAAAHVRSMEIASIIIFSANQWIWQDSNESN